ncbi:hypothetical protein AAFP30_22825 [Gordonia sp. CPCC 205515]|uniref:hypothetical protein n=1 Tax=Gordonia sp. CPCC 205515 TaxID=3140791 RepID=UPI003AF40784
MTVGRYGGFTTVYTGYNSLWLGIGYDSAARFDWHNLNTGKRGVQFSNTATRPPNAGTHGFSIPDRTIGNGRVQITLSTFNRNALWAIPAQTCSTTITLP